MPGESFDHSREIIMEGRLVATKHSSDNLERDTRQALEDTTQWYGAKPIGDAGLQGFLAFFLSAAVPYMGLRLFFGFKQESIETPLFIIGAVCGLCVWRYHEHCWKKWHRAFHQRENELMREREREKDEFSPDE